MVCSVLWVIVAMLLSVTAGCVSGGATDSSSANSSSTATTSKPVSTPVVTDVTSEGLTLKAETVLRDLRVPWEMRFLPDGRLLVAERDGRVVVGDVESGSVTEVGRIEVRARGEGGLMGLALDPDFPASPYIYVSFTHDQTGEPANTVSRFTVTGLSGGEALALGEEKVLLDGIPAGNIHDGSRVAFGPQGFLWVTTGDSGEDRLAQDMGSLAGKVLRMTRDGRTPPDNPFAGRGLPISLVYTLGHRNPQGLAFHPVTGQAYVTEHGPSDNDEVNLLVAGANYGWPDFRGRVGQTGYEDPLMTWTPTIAPAGALFYTGERLGDLKGALLFVTLKESDLRALRLQAGDPTTVSAEEVLFDGEFGRLRAIALGPDGALYVATSNHDGRGDPGPDDDRVLRIVGAE